MLTILLTASMLVAVQDSPIVNGAVNVGAVGSAGVVGAEEGGSSVSAEALRGRIHDMRMNLLLGGERVRQAESEAVAFYHGKIATLEGRVDSIHAELAEKRATYDVALDRTLSGKDVSARTSSMAQAATLRSEIGELAGESSRLDARRSHLFDLISAVEERDKERERLVAELETGPDLAGGFAFAMGTVGLAPAVGAAEPTSPLENDELVRDLLERDPSGARRILFEADPRGYWERFPLHPPAKELARALDFPPPDLPGLR